MTRLPAGPRREATVPGAPARGTAVSRIPSRCGSLLPRTEFSLGARGRSSDLLAGVGGVAGKYDESKP